MNESFRQPGIHAGEADGNTIWRRSPFSRWHLLRHAFSAEQSPAVFDLKVLNILLAFCFLLAMLQVLAAVFFTGDMAKAVVWLSMLLFVGGDFYLANVKKMRDLAILLLLVMAVFIILPLLWLMNAGVNGSNVIYVIIISSMIGLLTHGRWRLLAVMSLLFVISGLMFVEYMHPEWILYHETQLVRLQDIYLGLLSTILLNVILLSAGLKNYKRECCNLEKSQQELRYVSYHDSLTGVYNRNYFEKLVREDVPGDRAEKQGVFVVDIDGLKIINDSFGHEAGDALLIKAARCLQVAAGENATVCRIGGDEFAILLPAPDMAAMESLHRAIGAALQQENIYGTARENFFLQMAIGYAYDAEQHVSLKELFHAADEKMYREKVNHHSGGRGSLVQSLQQLLVVRDHSRAERTARMLELAVDFAKSFGLATSDLTELRLFVEFRDIGDIGVPEKLLQKPAAFSVPERRQMEKHVEIGYRIALSTQELQPIAAWILHHHEWWNGEGYPFGLQGEAIPWMCRMLAIVAAYEAMTSDRPYRQAADVKTALLELQLFAGRQFDPELVVQFVSFIMMREGSGLSQ